MPRKRKPTPIEELAEQHNLKPASEIPPPEPRESPTQAIIAAREEKPRFGPVPDGYLGTASWPKAGIRVLRSIEKASAAVQFAEDRLPSREEKDTLEIQGFAYDPVNRAWPRQDREHPGANTIDATRVAKELAEARMGRER